MTEIIWEHDLPLDQLTPAQLKRRAEGALDTLRLYKALGDIKTDLSALEAIVERYGSDN